MSTKTFQIKAAVYSLNTLLSVILITVVTLATIWGYSAYSYQKTQDTRVAVKEQYMLSNISTTQTYIYNNVTYLELSIINNNTYLNQTFTTEIEIINNEVALIQAELNITGGSGDVLANRVTLLENERLKTINGVPGSTMNNVDLIGGVGVTITPNPGSNCITIDAVGAGEETVITSTDGTIGVSFMGNTTNLSNNGVTQLNGMTGSIVLLGVDGIDVTENDTSINIGASGISTSIQSLSTQVQSIANDVALIEVELNMTTGSGSALTERVTDLENTRLATINEVPGNSMNNLDIIGGIGVTIIPFLNGSSIIIELEGGLPIHTITSMDGSILVAMTNDTVDLSNNGVWSITSLSPSIFLDSSTGNVQLTDNGVWSITSLSPSISLDMTTGNVQLTDNGVVDVNGFTGSVMIAGTDGITVSANMSYVNICAPILTTAISNLQMEDSNLAAQIMALQVESTNQQMQIDAIESAGTTIQEMFNNTDIDLDMFNTTLITLISQVMLLQSQVESLQMQLDNATSVSTPTGTILPWSGVSANLPTGFLHCDGAEYPIATYPDLFAIVGTMYCPSMTCSGGMFAVPNLLGRVPVGQGGSAFTTLGDQTQGTEMVTLTASQMPAHNHGGSVGAGGNHDHGGLTGQSTTTTGSFSVFVLVDANIDATHTGINFFNTAGHVHTISSVGTTHGHPIPISGNGDPHPNIQPSTVVNYMIKT